MVISPHIPNGSGQLAFASADRLTWQSELAHHGGEPVPMHVARHHMRPLPHCFGPHRHEFAEVFWIESGSGMHLINGERLPLAPGDVVFIRPDDVHGGHGIGRDGMTMVNVSFLPESMAPLIERFADEWPWRSGPMPMHTRLSSRRMERLHAWATELSSPYQRRLDLECFLLDLARLVTQPPENDVCAGLPAWLREAIEVFSDARHLPGGTARLAHLAGRSPEHINRVVRAAQGRTATDLINVVRMRWAASALRMSNRAIGDIAAECGLPHLGHFYETFKQHFRVTPRRYRVDAWQATGHGQGAGNGDGDGAD